MVRPPPRGNADGIITEEAIFRELVIRRVYNEPEDELSKASQRVSVDYAIGASEMWNK